MSQRLIRFVAILLLLCFPFSVVAGTCEVMKKVCLDAAPTKVVNGVSVSLAELGLDCWKSDNVYRCAETPEIHDCASYTADPTCKQVDASCTVWNADKTSCLTERRTFSCTSAANPPGQVLVCNTQALCLDPATCFDVGHENDKDMAAVISALEAGREAGVYMDDFKLFKGYASECDKFLDGDLFGLGNCCKKDTKSGGSMTNGAIWGAAATVAGGYVEAGSWYVYDALFNADSTSIITQGLGSMLGFDGVPSWGSPSFTLYGFQFQIVGGMPSFVGFDPTSFAISVAILLVQMLLACTEDEQVLAIKRGEDLCHYVGSYCSEEILDICIIETESYCCWNSKLARIINEQGMPQLGKNFGSAEHPKCTGFTQAEFEMLDFSLIDLSEFYADIVPKQEDLEALGAQMQERIQSMAAGSAQ